VEENLALELIKECRIPIIQGRIDGPVMGPLNRLLEDLAILSNDSRLDEKTHKGVNDAWHHAATALAHLDSACRALDTTCGKDAPRVAGLLKPVYRRDCPTCTPPHCDCAEKLLR